MSSPQRLRLAGPELVLLYTMGWVGALIVLGVAVGLLVLADLLVKSGGDPGVMAAWAEGAASGSGGALPTWILAVTLMMQAPAMVVLIPFAWAIIDWRTFHPLTGASGRTEGWTGMLALRRTPWVFLGLGMAAGLTVGLLPGWYAHQMSVAFPSLSNGALGMINGALTSGHPVWRGVLAIEIAVIVPLAEELVFRGFMWDALRRYVSLPTTWIVTSAIFCAYHMDPLQSSAIIPTALMLGWLRWTSGSLWPAVLLHVFNNGLGVSAGFLSQGDVDPPLSLALAGAALTLVWVVIAYRARARRDLGVLDTPLA